MALPVLIKPQTFGPAGGTAVAAQGTQLATNRRLLRTIKDMILALGSGAIFTVRYSCNSTTAGTAGDGVDHWSTDASLVSANNGVAHSWIVLRSIANWEILISLESVSSGLTSCSIWISYGSPFTGGTTTARPTAPLEFALVTNGAWGGGSDVAYRVHARAPTDGTSLHLDICTAGTITQVWDIVMPTNIVSATTNPIVGRIATASANLYTSSVMLNNATWIGRANDGTILAISNIVGGRGSSGASASFFTAVDAKTGGWPVWAIGFSSTTTVGHTSADWGVWPDAYWTVDAATLATGSTAPLTPSATFLWVKRGNLFTPNDGANYVMS